MLIMHCYLYMELQRFVFSIVITVLKTVSYRGMESSLKCCERGEHFTYNLLLMNFIIYAIVLVAQS